jgi:hypothetical protein
MFVSVNGIRADNSAGTFQHACAHDRACEKRGS